WRSTPMIWASVYRVFFIGISSVILPRKFYFRIPLRSGGITAAHACKYRGLSSFPRTPCIETLRVSSARCSPSGGGSERLLLLIYADAMPNPHGPLSIWTTERVAPDPELRFASGAMQQRSFPSADLDPGRRKIA
ncbi:hypothetical protein J7376_16815, partial [Paracoccus sp. R12_1]|uniref:hypothetical protein n=1 Tax=unclassified Paracoccus (in: a-proteobacteria) TaxID=2688777 RepID=UPI001ADBB536